MWGLLVSAASIVVLQRFSAGLTVPPRDAWQCLQTSFTVTLGTGCCWQLCTKARALLGTLPWSAEQTYHLKGDSKQRCT